MLEKMTDKQLREWYYSELKKRANQDGLQASPDFHGKQSRTRHDLWSMYQIGDTIKVVYFKALPPVKKERPLFSDLPPKPIFEKQKRSDADRFASSISRARNRIFELAMCNEFTYFCTFTQDQEKRNRFDLAEFRKDFAQLVRNLNRDRQPDSKIKYLLIPEQHKNGAWHMHGLLMGLTDGDLRKFELSEKLPLSIKKQLRKGEAVYDWTRYRKAFGYFTCTEIKDRTACSKYITKYISKDLQKTVREAGEHLFFASQGLKGREPIVKNCTEPCPITEWDFENEYVKIYELKIPKSEKTDTEKYTAQNLS
jgi:hypothetical protein